MMLSSEERAVLEGSQGEILQRVMATIVAYAFYLLEIFKLL